MQDLLEQIRNCTLCAEHLPLGPRPVIRAHRSSRILVIGQAPGTRVHETGIPWNDPSGKNLRKWMGVTDEQFYDSGLFAIVPMGFCYPGKGKSGDLPPRPECAAEWHERLLAKMPNIELTLLIGQYAQSYYLEGRKENLTETVRSFKEYLPKYFPLVHPSPRNGIWMRKNLWFEEEVLPVLQHRVQQIME
ncbi:uracil-DNA glycosylase family protein [Roseivirga thermotolerans]|uniref:uracil-DNA glycosylase family protein n=1 Tax=Roseivirga thermotolerans TaxID=1758176 RepID=UPI0027402C4E|nr:uracil-DNA glycosylase family protein [Roseivirga thermotolerans]